MTRFNEAVDQLLVESMTRYAHDVERAQDMYLGVLGHDLRNPLGAIMMSASVMMTNGESDDPHSKTAARILNAGTRMDGLIGDLVDFTRSRIGGGIPIVRADMDMQTVCRQAVDEIAAFRPRGVVHFNASGELIGQWDSARIAQALSNLVGNAFQHGAENAPIDVSLRGEADHVVLTVHNKGPRIPKIQLQRIFDPFKQLKPSTKSDNSRSIGLGLYIVKSIVTAHRGTIEVESTDDGTTFTVRLPRLAGEVERSESSAAKHATH